LYKAYTIHEKKYGDWTGIEDVIVSKRKFQYEEEVKANPNNYDAWFDCLHLVESEGDLDIIRETYERAVANVPPTKEKSFWHRYIYLWINCAGRQWSSKAIYELAVNQPRLDMPESLWKAR
jgi:crooked neck